VHVADAINFLLPPKMARKVVAEIYEAAGMRQILSFFANRRWRPPKGFAARLHKFAEEESTTLARYRGKRHSQYCGGHRSTRQERGSGRISGGLNKEASRESVKESHSRTMDSVADEEFTLQGEPNGSFNRGSTSERSSVQTIDDIGGLTRAHQSLEKKVDRLQQVLGAQLGELTAQMAELTRLAQNPVQHIL